MEAQGLRTLLPRKAQYVVSSFGFHGLEQERQFLASKALGQLTAIAGGPETPGSGREVVKASKGKESLRH